MPFQGQDLSCKLAAFQERWYKCLAQIILLNYGVDARTALSTKREGPHGGVLDWTTQTRTVLKWFDQRTEGKKKRRGLSRFA